MTNLLPKEYRKKINLEYGVRLFTVFLFFLAATGLITSVFLTPTILEVREEYRALNQRKKELEKESMETKELVEIERATDQLKNNVVALSQFEKIKFTEVISKVIANKNQGIKIYSVVYKNKGDEIEVSLRGESATRDILIDFAKKLENTESFAKINLPVSDLAKDRDIVFSITFSIL